MPETGGKDSHTLSYEDVSHIVEEIVNVKAYFAAFDIYDTDDIAQEIRIKCFELIRDGKYDKSKKSSIKTWLIVCVDNMLRNLLRDKFFSFEIPCKTKKCPEYKENVPCSKASTCEHISYYVQKKNSKMNIMNTVVLDDFNVAFASMKTNLHATDGLLDHDIRENLPDELVFYYEELKNGKKIGKQKLDEIRRITREIIEGED